MILKLRMLSTPPERNRAVCSSSLSKCPPSANISVRVGPCGTVGVLAPRPPEDRSFSSIAAEEEEEKGREERGVEWGNRARPERKCARAGAATAAAAAGTEA